MLLFYSGEDLFENTFVVFILHGEKKIYDFRKVAEFQKCKNLVDVFSQTLQQLAWERLESKVEIHFWEIKIFC